MDARYRSTLVVTGMLPGRYEYVTTNRATVGGVQGTFTVEGMVIAANLLYVLHEPFSYYDHRW